MRRFLIKGFIFFLAVASISYGVDYMIQEGIKTSNYREVTKWNEVITGGIDAEILIVGSSRALVHFDCEYIEKVTGKTCYNLGFDGTTYPLQKLMLELYLSRNQKPQELIWSLDFHSFSFSSDFYGFEQLIPYFDNLYIKGILALHKTPYYQFFIPLFRYSYNPKMKVIGLYSFLGNYEREPVIIKGYRHQDKVWDNTFNTFVSKNPQGEKVSFDKGLFQDFEHYAAKLNSTLKISWIITPYYVDAQKIFTNSNEIIELYSNSAKSLKIPFVDKTKDSIIFSKAYFYNGIHLNVKGVQNFSNSLFQ